MGKKTLVGPFPGFIRFAWLVFMQPTKLYELFQSWRLGRNPTLWKMRHRLRGRDPIIWMLVSRCVALLLLVPGIILIFGGMLELFGISFEWTYLSAGINVGGVSGIFLGAIVGVPGVCFGIIFGVVGGVIYGLPCEVPDGVVSAISLGLLMGLFRGLNGVVLRVREGIVGGIALGAVAAVVIFYKSNLPSGILGGLTFLVVFILVCFRVPLNLLEALLTILIAAIVRVAGVSARRLASFLPFLHHDFIYLELPGLRSFLLHLAEEEFSLGRRVIAEAAGSVGQQRAARFVLFELENRSLERAARERLYTRTANGDLPFLSGDDEVVRPFMKAASDLRAASTSRNHLHRRRALDRAVKVLEEARDSIAKKKRSDRWDRRRLITLRTWLDVVGEERAALAREEAEHPQVPLPFVAGPTLGPAERELFKGRGDLIRIIDHDLTGDRRAPILLIGQRRMGKSSLVSMLPIHLGTGTRVIPVSFQGLSGSSLKERPDLWIAEAIAETGFDGSTAPGNGAAWGETLDWLRDLDRRLEQDDRRLLVALDEIERLEEGIREGWANTDLLDLIRAAGDVLYRVRFLLATAYPLPRLGPHWVDRLINVLTRQLRPLSPADAESLIREPMPGFPDIYPSDGVERILAATGGHPYLIQLVCDTLCRHLNEEERLKATGGDIDLAIDRAILETPLFDELWRQRTVEERQVLRDLATSGSISENRRTAARDLEREGFLSRSGGGLAIAVPMFADWIADRGPAPTPGGRFFLPP